MPNQTSKSATLRVPDGCKVQIQESTAGSYSDIGVLIGDVGLTFNYDTNIVDSANKGKILNQIRNMTVAGDFTLVDYDPDNINRLGNGIFTKETQTGTLVSTIDNQVIASGDATELVPYNLVIVETGGSALKASAAPTIASVTGATDGSLAANDDYQIQPDAQSSSGFSIVFNTAGTTLTTMAQQFTIAYTSVTPLSYTELYAGTSTFELLPYKVKFTHTNSSSVVDFEFELYSAYTQSGGLAFGFKGAASDGVDELPVTLEGQIDTALVDGKQLFRYYTGA